MKLEVWGGQKLKFTGKGSRGKRAPYRTQGIWREFSSSFQLSSNLWHIYEIIPTTGQRTIKKNQKKKILKDHKVLGMVIDPASLSAKPPNSRDTWQSTHRWVLLHQGNNQPQNKHWFYLTKLKSKTRQNQIISKSLNHISEHSQKIFIEIYTQLASKKAKFSISGIQ